MKPGPIVSSINLREVYAQTGEFTAKMLIDPRQSQGIESVSVDIRDSDGLPMRFSHRRWGTKLTLDFVIDRKTPDGVSLVYLGMRRRDGSMVQERLSFWVIKE